MNPTAKLQLSEKQLLVLQSEMVMRRKSVLMAYVIFFLPPGPFGGHHWYLGHVGRSLLYLLCGLACVGGFAVMAFSRNPQGPNTGFGAVIAGYVVYLLMLLFDGVTLAWQVGNANRRIERKIIRSLQEPIPAVDPEVKTQS